MFNYFKEKMNTVKRQLVNSDRKNGKSKKESSKNSGIQK